MNLEMVVCQYIGRASILAHRSTHPEVYGAVSPSVYPATGAGHGFDVTRTLRGLAKSSSMGCTYVAQRNIQIHDPTYCLVCTQGQQAHACMHAVERRAKRERVHRYIPLIHRSIPCHPGPTGPTLLDIHIHPLAIGSVRSHRVQFHLSRLARPHCRFFTCASQSAAGWLAVSFIFPCCCWNAAARGRSTTCTHAHAHQIRAPPSHETISTTTVTSSASRRSRSRSRCRCRCRCRCRRRFRRPRPSHAHRGTEAVALKR